MSKLMPITPISPERPTDERGKSLLARVQATGTPARLVEPLTAALWWLIDMSEAEAAAQEKPEDWSQVGR